MRPLLPLALILSLAACDGGEPLTPPDARLPDGSRYRGELVDGLLQGQGRLDYPTGAWYEGEFRDGLFDGQGVLKYPGGDRYEGGFRKGLRHGEGLWVQGEDRYRGEFRDDLQHGFGILELGDGSSHQGQFEAGRAQGPGVRKDAEGNRFSGAFVDDQLEGPGRYEGAEGDSYLGAFHAGVFEGDGRYQSADGDVWSGRFREGALHGEGTFEGSDGTRYQGQFRDWRFHGQGRLEKPDGSVHEGGFRNGQPDGEGVRISADGSRQAGVWRGGRRVRDENGHSLPDPLELALLRQSQLLTEALAELPFSTPAVELYGLSVAGDGGESVFLREARFASQVLRERLGAHGVVMLANHRDHLDDLPMATREHLRIAIQTLAERSGPEDLVLLFLTSHGSSDHQLSLRQPRLDLDDLPAAELAALLEPLRDRQKVVVISACYSGGFIDPLRDGKTLVMTAARRDRTSFGCAEDNDLTYFGRALLEKAFAETQDLQQAFERARDEIARREAEEELTPSEPQLWAEPVVLQHWRQWRQTATLKEKTATESVMDAQE